MVNPVLYFKNLKIRSKLLAGYTLIFIVATLAGGAVIYSKVRRTIEKNIESELSNATATILNMVRTSADTSIKNHLRAVAEKNREIVSMIHGDFLKGIISEEQAKRLSRKVLFSQKIGDTGYIFCGNSKGIAIEHPFKGIAGKSFMQRSFVKDMLRMKNGYLEYGWKNPSDTEILPKAMYMSYFEPWDWIISASSYRHEFNKLVNTDDFKKSVLSLKFGETGYSYIFNSKGKIIIHPFTKGDYTYLRDNKGNLFLKEIMRIKNGKLIYPWKNPGEKLIRQKMVIFNYLPEYDWIVASAIYLDEMYKPLKTIRNIIIITVLVITGLVFITSFGINISVIKPLKDLMDQLSKGAEGDLKIRMPVNSKDEIGELAGYFNSFMDKLERSARDLEEKALERERSKEALKLSEEMFSKAFRSSPGGMIIATLKDTRILNVNDSFLKITGHSMFELVGNELLNVRFFYDRKEGQSILEKLAKGRKRPFGINFKNVKGDKRSGLISAEKVQVWGESCILVAIEDLTEARQLEREILNISEKERQKIAMELHDDLCPQLIGIEVLLKILKERFDGDDDEASIKLGNIRSLVLDSIKKTRQLSMGLFPVNLAEKAFDSSLYELSSYIEETFSIPCDLIYEVKEPLSDNSLASHLYYIIHEAVHNSVKHGRADRIKIDIGEEKDQLSIKVIDNGTGVNKSDSEFKGIGMKIMQYRATRIGAELSIKSSGSGTEVILLMTKGSI